MKKVYCLYRVSSKNMEEKHDIPMQRIACEKFAEEKGWYIAKEFIENGVSGYSVSCEKRDAIIKLKTAAKKKEFDILLVFIFDRLGRKKNETPFVVEWFAKQGIEVWSTREGEQRFDNDVDSLINYIRFWQAEGESRKIGERVNTRINQLVDAGLYTGGLLSLGYKCVFKGRLNKKGYPVPDVVIDDINANTVKEIFNKTVFEGYGSYSLANWCNEQGFKTQTGNKFQYNTILRILKNRRYCGYLINGSHISPHFSELQIIDEALFEHVQYILSQRIEKDSKKRQIALNTKGESLLSGNIFCGYCGSRMISSNYTDKYVRKDGSVNEQRYIRYICYHRSRKLNECKGQAAYVAQKIEPMVLQSLNSIFNIFQKVNDKNNLEKYIDAQIKENIKERDRIQFKINELSEEHAVLIRQIASSLTGDNTFSTETLRQAIFDNEQSSNELCRQLEMVLDDIKDTQRIIRLSEFYYNQITDCAENYNSFSKMQKKMMICQLFSRIELFYKYQIVLHMDKKYRLIFLKYLSEIEIENCTII